MYTCKYFKPEELVGPEFYHMCEKTNRVGRIFTIFDPTLLKVIDLLREKYGSCTINNWKTGGPRKESGLRMMDTSTGAVLSAHKFGRAVDCIFSKVSAEEIRQDMKRVGCFNPGFRSRLMKEPELEVYNVARVEWHDKGVPISWLHIDCLWNDANEDGSVKIIDV